jgi:GTPase SAR1 family protein
LGIAVLVIGESGSGKTASLRNFQENDVSILNVASKPLPFKNKNKLKMANKATYSMIKGAVSSGRTPSYVIDDAQYLMAFESFDKVNETGYTKFSVMAKNYEDMLRHIQEETDPNVIVYVLQHIDKDEDGKIKAKTLGKMLDQQLTVEGLFSIVLMAQTDGKRHYFVTQSDGTNPCKSPMGLFDDIEIDNDLKMVDDAIREYYELSKTVAKKPVKKT